MLATPDIIRENAQDSRLAEVLARWRDVPLYRDVLAAGQASSVTLDHFPFVTKREIREGFPDNFLHGGQSLESLLAQDVVELDYTSGTSEEQTPVLFERGWWRRQEEAALRLNPFVAGVLDEFPEARRATLTTPTCNGRVCDSRWRPQAHRVDGTTLFVNVARIPFLVSDADSDRMAEEIRDWAPVFLDVDPVHAVRFALYCERRGIVFPSLRFILCSYEFLSVVHRRVLERVFRVPVLNLYGSTETGHLLMEGAQGEMRPSLATAFLEIIEPGTDGVGDLAITTLSNDYMPLIRYRVGDLAERVTGAYATTYVVHGRARDALRAADGRRVTTWQVDQCFAGIGGLAHYQLRQASDGSCRLRLVRESAGPGDSAMPELTARLEALIGFPGQITTEAVDLLVPAPSGKFRLTVRA